MVLYDKNGNMTAGSSSTFVYNWDNKLRSAAIGGDSIALKYDPMGNRTWKQSTVSSQSTKRKYIVDIVGELPTILLEMDPDNSFKTEKTYIYANSQILAQHDVISEEQKPLYFYLHDRLGSVRMIINTAGTVQKTYTYQPFGQLLEPEEGGTFDNPFMFAGQWFDEEIGQYYLRARMYDPYLYRFTTFDPVGGKFTEPMTLHKYLYCGNDPVNFIDRDGKWAVLIGGSISGNYTEFTLKAFKNFGIMGGVLAHNAIISMLCSEVAFGFGGTFGAGAFFGKGEEGWFGGSMQWSAVGGSVASGSGVSLTLDVGYSPNAQKAQDLAGGFTEFGASVTGPAPVGSVFFFANAGVSYAIGDNDTELWTVYGGAAYSSWGWGVEDHVYRGYATVQEW